MQNAIRTCLLVVILISSSASSAAPLALEQYTVLVALTLNFAHFTQWPEQAFANSGNNLQVCLVGDNALLQSFDSISGKAVGNRVIKIINTDKLRNLNQCHILFLSELSNSVLSQVFLDTKQYPVLTIGEEADFIGSGGMVAMVNTDGKIQLHINLAMVKSSGLTISSSLLRLAKIVGDN
ncbi:YfiR family protein [Methylomonas fluvii]|uniref:YfiR family protein n=1 Tax=Methylomonas fluvii TaxID=1854564 RepID=A0ABR9DHG6_9GAMM|nr:YfiR family protein [Methylomonas fluvii]MBD9362522.1 YfiR family protein [Methylomonas fluvii]CAD6875627.1 putative transmembrane protein [Methylomonas fluvii]